MMSAKKTMLTVTPDRNYQRQLEQLYARRSAIDALIASLKDYDRYKAPSRSRLSGQRKSA